MVNHVGCTMKLPPASRARADSAHRQPIALSGVVLVGGRSTRMGRDKARLMLDGRPLWQRQLHVLEQAGAQPVRLALRRAQRSLGDKTREIRDPLPDVGPLGGLYAALSAPGSAEWVAVLAVDLPRIEAAWFRRLRKYCRPGIGAVVVHPAGFEPLAAIYPHAALPIVTRRLARNQLALQGLVQELVRRRLMVAVPRPKALARQTENWNAPGDVRRK